MEKYLLEDFKKELIQIKEYITHIQQVDNLIDTNIPDDSNYQQFKTHFISFRNDKKIFEYKATIISLYGLLEKHIDIWIQAYLRNLSKLVSYNELTEQIRSKHFELSMKLINLVIEGRQEKFSRLKKEDILKKLNNCLENLQPYKLNEEAFTIQSGNLKLKRIEEIFNTININIHKELIKNAELINLTGANINHLQNTDGSVLFGKINEIVERRNEIAHGSRIDELLHLSALEQYIEFLEKYCIAIFQVLKEKDIENQTIIEYKEVTCIKVFPHKNVIGISLEEYTIKIGDWIIIKTAELGNEHFYKQEIKSLGKDKIIDYKEIQIKELTNISIGIEKLESLTITQNCTFYLKIN